MPLSGDRSLVFTVGVSPARDWGTSIQIGEALWRARLRMGLTLEEVARRAGVTLGVAGAIEDSAFDRLPSREMAVTVAQAYARVVRLPKRWVAMTLSTILSRRDERTIGNPSLAVVKRRTPPHADTDNALAPTFAAGLINLAFHSTRILSTHQADLKRASANSSIVRCDNAVLFRRTTLPFPSSR